MSADSPVADRRFVVIGGGPAGLTAAYELTRQHAKTVVLEKLDKAGGIARTEYYKGYRFDMGGHRFFTKDPTVNRLWQEVLSHEFLRRPRLSRIYYNQRFFEYPLKPFDALRKLGILECTRVLLSYLRWQIRPYKNPETFEEWVCNRFGRRLFEVFFKTYTEKVGIPCSVLKAEWAAQRIKDFSLKTAMLSMVIKPKNTITTLIEEFDYPRLGPGMMWETFRQRVIDGGGEVRMNSEAMAVHREGNRITGVTVEVDGSRERLDGTDFISSMPITEFIKKLDPPPGPEVMEAAGALRYRDFLTVGLIINQAELFPDNWIYVHEPRVEVGRIQNYKNWSPDMVPDPSKTGLGLEYFCTEGDDLWTRSDEDLVEQAKREIEFLGMARAEDVEDGCVFRVPKAYPIYDGEYREALDILRAYVDGLANFQTVGRNGLHRYNNQDHAMLTGILAVQNLVHGETNDLWVVNADREYHEEIREEVGSEVTKEAVQAALAHVFAKVDAISAGLASGLLAGLLLFLATIILVIKGGEVVGPNMQILNQILPGYTVSVGGSILGFFQGFAGGFILGSGLAFLRNLVYFFHLVGVRKRADLQVLRKALDYI